MGTVVGVNQNRLAERGQEIYERIKHELEPTHRGKVVAIEVESGDYFLGESVVAAAKKARAKHPDKHFYFVRVGFPSVHIRR